MSAHQFHTDELVMDVPEGFADDTANMLEWPAEGGGIALMIRRRVIVAPATFDSMAKTYTTELKARLSAYRDETPPELRVQVPHKTVCFRFQEHGRVAYQVHLLIEQRGRVMFIIWGGPARHREMVDALAKQSFESIMIRDNPDR
jgi:hypothetical protein